MALLMLLDGNSLTYRAFFALPTDLATASGQVTNAVYGFTSMLVNLIKDHKPDYLAVAFDRPEPTFRHDLVAGYKATRSAAPDILRQQMGLVRQLVETMRIPVVEAPGYEADDVLATLATKAAAEGDDVIVVTGDRDTYQLVADPHLKVLYNRRGVSDYVLYDEAGILARTGVTPAQYADFASLRGDPSDNLPGVPGVGEKTAARLISTYGDLDGIYAHLDELTPRLRDALVAGQEPVRSNARVIPLVRDLDVSLVPGEAEVGGWDVTELRRLFEFLEFRTLWDRFVEATGIANNNAAAGPEPAEQLVVAIEAMDAAAALDGIGAWAGTGAALAVAGSWDGREGRSPLNGLAFALVSAAGEDGTAARAWWLESRLLDDAELRGALGELLGPGGTAEVSAHDAKALMRSLAMLGVDFVNLELDTSIAAYLVDPASDQYLLEDSGGPLRRCGDRPGGDHADRPARSVGRGRAGPDGRGTGGGHRPPDPAPVRRPGSSRDVAPVRRGGEAVGQGAGPHGARRCARGLGRAGPLGTPAGRRGPHPGEPGARSRRHPVPGELGTAAQGNPLQQAGPDPGEEDQDGVFHRQPDAGETARRTPHNPGHPALPGNRKTPLDLYRRPPGRAGPDGRIHATFNQTVARTGRLSSDAPNLHNIPVRTEEGRQLRRVFVPADGMRFLVADYNQIELRVIAHLAQDPGLIEAFRTGADIHRMTAARIFGVEPGEVTIGMRSRAKMVSYGLAYGMEAYGLAQRLAIGVDEAAEILKAYFDSFPRVRAYMDEVVAEARHKGYTETLFGRRRLIPELSSDRYQVRMAGERQAMNAGIQGLAADIFKVALVRLDARLDEEALRGRLVLQVHDEVILEVPPDEEEAAAEAVIAAMRGAAELSVPLEVNLSWGRSWADAKA